jgi:hypothetical protein
MEETVQDAHSKMGPAIYKRSSEVEQAKWPNPFCTRIIYNFTKAFDFMYSGNVLCIWSVFDRIAGRDSPINMKTFSCKHEDVYDLSLMVITCCHLQLLRRNNIFIKSHHGKDDVTYTIWSKVSRHHSVGLNWSLDVTTTALTGIKGGRKLCVAHY